MKYCSNCGEKIKDTSKYCMNCGCKIDDIVDVTFEDVTVKNEIGNCEVPENNTRKYTYFEEKEKINPKLKPLLPWIPSATLALLAIITKKSISGLLFAIVALFLMPLGIITDTKEKLIPKKGTRAAAVAITILLAFMLSNVHFAKTPAENEKVPVAPKTTQSPIKQADEKPQSAMLTPEPIQTPKSVNESKSTVKPVQTEKPVNESKLPTESVASDVNTKKEELKISSTEDEKTVNEFKQEDALKAVIVSMTNCYAYDVFTDDGNDYDPAKFHKYGEKSSSALSLYQDGRWTRTSNDMWHVDELILKMDNNVTEFYLRLSADITYDGEKYIVDNVKANHQSLKYLYDTDPSKYNGEEYCNPEYNLFLVVPQSLIK